MANVDCYLKIEIDTPQKHIRCAVDITYHEKKSGIIRFYLYSKLNIDIIRLNGKKVPHDEENKGAQFKPYAKTVTVANTECSLLSLSYFGRIDGDISRYNNGIYDDFILLTDYAPWFPSPVDDDDFDMHVEVSGINDYTLINGHFHDRKNAWMYDGSMLLCVKNHKIETTQTGNFRFFVMFYDPEERKSARKYASLAKECVLFYEEKILKRDLPHQNLGFFRPNHSINTGWTFIRDGITVSGGQLVDDDRYAAWLLGHELAHIWSEGAQANWEDWLNESFAEYASMLFLESKYGVDAYEEKVKQLREKNEKEYKMQSIKPPEGESRPDSVQTKGSLAFDELRKFFGYDTMCQIIRIFDKLENKTTDHLLDAIRKENKNEVADWLARKITEPF